MLDDNLNEAKLRKMIGAARFETPEDFQDELEGPLKKNFFIDEERIKTKAFKSEKRFDMRITDPVSQMESLILIGFKVVKDGEKIDELDFQNFHQECLKKKTIYGVLLNESEIHFYEYKTGKPAEIKEIPPLNYTDAEYEDHMTPEKYMDWLISRKYWVIGISLLVILMLSMSLAHSKQCELSGPIKAEVRSDGQKMYYLPETAGYSGRTTGDQPGERRYCDEKDAIDDGFILAK